MTGHWIILRLTLTLAVVAGMRTLSPAGPLPAPHTGPPLSQAAMASRFAQVNQLGAVDLNQLEVAATQGEPARQSTAPEAALASGVLQVNADYNRRPQNETAIAVNYAGNRWIVGANDYGIGVPIGGGVYTSEGITSMLVYPLLVANTGTGLIQEPPAGTGDPAVVYGRTRATASLPAGQPVAYMTTLGVSASFCENGIFLYRSLDNGFSWTRPVVPPLAPPHGLRTAGYWDQAFDCSVFHDKEWITVDTTGGPHDGRIYVTWSKFEMDASGTYLRSPIVMAYSDDNGDTFSPYMEISGANAELCRYQITGPAGECDEDQASSPVVDSTGRLIVAFENEQFNGATDGYRNQYLVVTVDPDTLAVSGPYLVAHLFDGANDYPVNSDSRPTLCNSNFRQWSVGNLAIGPADELYVVWSDNRAHAGEFPFPTAVGDRASGYACPAGKETDTDIFISQSTDGGQTWSDAVRVNQDALHNNKDQWFPWVAVAPHHRVEVVYYDRRQDPGNKLAHTFLGRSHTSGVTWRDQQVSSFASNFDNAFFGLGSFIGDYNGLAISGRGVSFPVWTGVIPRKMDSDIFMSIVEP